MASAARVRVLHVNDAASTAKRILERAALDQQPWSFYPRAFADPMWAGYTGRIRYAARGSRWLAGLHAASAGVDLLHIHSGSMLRHMRTVRRPFVLHLHGTDIRTLQYDPDWRKIILSGVKRARAVLYPTPELAEHILPHRPDAIYFPIPVTLRDLPERAKHPNPRVFFCSRWEAVKGLDDQLAIAAILKDRLPADLELVGLEWGPGSDRAREAGVRLIPKMTSEDYLQYIANSAAIVGQSAGILATSELETLGIGAPLYAPLKPGCYGDDVPVGGGAAAWKNPRLVAERLLQDLTSDMTISRGSEWIRRNHETEIDYNTLVGLYPTLVTGKKGAT